MRRRIERRLLGLDPGLRHLGYAVVDLRGGLLVPRELGVVRSRRDPDARRSEDNLLNAMRAAGELGRLVRWGSEDGEPSVRVICAEAMSYPPGVTSPALMSLCWGAIAATSERDGVPVVQTSPQRIKRVVAGRASASKDEIRNALFDRFGDGRMLELLEGIPEREWEHACDALAAVIAAVEAPMLGKFKRSKRGKKKEDNRRRGAGEDGQAVDRHDARDRRARRPASK